MQCFRIVLPGLNEDGMPLFYDVEGNKLDSSNPDIAIEVYSNVDNLKYEGTRDPVFSAVSIMLCSTEI